MIYNNLANHVFKISYYQGYGLIVKFAFKGKYNPTLINFYYSPKIQKNLEIRSKICNWIKIQIQEAINAN